MLSEKIYVLRRKNGLSQKQLAEKIGVSRQAISKWENGIGTPDSSIMLKLCTELDISVNELLNGEMINMNDYNQNAEKKLLEFKKIDENKNKKLFLKSLKIFKILSTNFS